MSNLCDTTSKMDKVPYSDLISHYVSRDDRRAIDVRQAGVPECVVAGWASYRYAYPPLPEHQHFRVAELAYAEIGRQPYAVADRCFTLQGGEGIIIPPDTLHSSDNQPSYPCKKYWFQLLLPSDSSQPWLGLTPAEAEPLVTMLRTPTVQSAKWPADFPRRISALFGIFDGPVSPIRTAMLRTGLLTILFDLLNLQEEKTLPANQMRIRQAIAFECGFSSSQYFATVFKRIVGVTPNDRHASNPS